MGLRNGEKAGMLGAVLRKCKIENAQRVPPLPGRYSSLWQLALGFPFLIQRNVSFFIEGILPADRRFAYEFHHLGTMWCPIQIQRQPSLVLARMVAFQIALRRQSPKSEQVIH